MAESLARHALFADVPAATLAGLAIERDRSSPRASGCSARARRTAGLHVVLEGEAGVVIDGEERAVIHAGMFFGEISVLLDEPVAADVFARTPLRCAVIDRAD